MLDDSPSVREVEAADIYGYGLPVLDNVAFEFCLVVLSHSI